MSEKGWVYEDNGVTVYRASSLYSCIRSMTAARLGESTTGPNAGLRAAMDASAGLEDVLLKRTAAQLRGQLIWEQKEVELVVLLGRKGDPNCERVIVRGHIDALHQEGDEIIEAKALGDANYEKYIDGGLDAMGNLGLKYKWQGAVYGHAIGRKVRFAIGHKVKTEDGFVIEDVDISQPYAPEDLVPMSQIVERIRTVEEYAAMDSLPDCDFGCRESDPFSESHLFASAKQGDDRLEDLLHSYDEASWQVKNAQDRKDEIRDVLIEEYGLGKHTAGPFSMNIIRVQSSRFDTKWLKKTMPDVYDQGLVPSESIRVNVTNPSKKGQEEAG